jgi:hypothetical protein
MWITIEVLLMSSVAPISGKRTIGLRTSIPVELHDALVQIKILEGVTINETVEHALVDYLAKYKRSRP